MMTRLDGCQADSKLFAYREAAFARTPPADYSAAEAESFATLVSHVFVVRKHHRWRNFSSGAQQEEICST